MYLPRKHLPWVHRILRRVWNTVFYVVDIAPAWISSCAAAAPVRGTRRLQKFGSGIKKHG
ncbi:MAG TPA: hypothetical protein VHU84_14735 [Lacipirellulaceae bacterium]|nr:hypothetical protein [Lacipirellulaceae bacterium]